MERIKAWLASWFISDAQLAREAQRDQAMQALIASIVSMNSDVAKMTEWLAVLLKAELARQENQEARERKPRRSLHD